MSEVDTNPASGEAPGAATGQPEVGDHSHATAEATASSGDYSGRISAGGDFAVSEVKKHQGRADRAEQEHRTQTEWMGELGRYRTAGLSGTQIADHLDQYSRVLQNPEMAKLVADYIRTNEVPKVGNSNHTSSPSDYSDEEYLSDEQKEIRALKSELGKVRQSSMETTHAQGAMALQGHLERLQTEYNLSGDQFDKVRDGLVQQVQGWQGQGVQGEAAMKNLMGPDGYKAVEIMISSQLGLGGMLELAKGQLLRQDSTLRSMATDGPSSSPPGEGSAPAPIFKTGIEALRAVRANPDLANSIRY